MELEEHIRLIEHRLETLDSRLDKMEGQMGRLTSHIESEVGLARRDIGRIETKLFGKDDDDIYGGRIGQLARSQSKSEKIVAYAAGFVAALMLIGKVLELLR